MSTLAWFSSSSSSSSSSLQLRMPTPPRVVAVVVGGLSYCMAQVSLLRALLVLSSIFVITTFLLHLSIVQHHDVALNNNVNQEASQRLLFEVDHPPYDVSRIQDHVNKLRTFSAFAKSTTNELDYDIYHCPAEPPPNYPFSWNVIDVLRNWNPNDVDEKDWPKVLLYQSLCVFDWKTDRHKAEKYRNAELPFVLQNHPDVLRTTERWTTPGYLSTLLGGGASVLERTDHSMNNHFMYWKQKMSPQFWPADYKPPTDTVDMTFDEWHAKATRMESTTTTYTTNQEHWYFRLNGVYNMKNIPEAHDYLYDELPYFRPTNNNFFIVEPDQQRGINCRFGMKGTISEAHHDGARNFIVLLRGQRRYILAHPNQCSNMELYPFGHPSERQSSVDWSTRLPTNDSTTSKFQLDHPQFCKARVHQVVLQAGDAMYLPTFWFHYVVGLNTNYQCNARSGTSYENIHLMAKCGQ